MPATILIDGTALTGMTLESLHSQVALIPQDPSLFHRSLIDNIRYGKPDASDDEVIAAARKAHAHDFIEQMPEGYASMVGERGVKLSGGQRQRIAIARVILKDAPVLILDEATSALDSITETAIQETLDQVMHGKTVIVVAHRLSTIAHLDRILVFDHGRIVEDGSHAELLAAHGAYWRLWSRQAGGFLADDSSNAHLAGRHSGGDARATPPRPSRRRREPTTRWRRCRAPRREARCRQVTGPRQHGGRHLPVQSGDHHPACPQIDFHANVDSTAVNQARSSASATNPSGKSSASG